jgi:ribonuclease HI
MAESTCIPTSTDRIAVPVIIESRQQAGHAGLSMSKAWIKCLWTDGSRDDLGNVGAAVAWKEVDEWTGLQYRLGRNKEVFDAELFSILQTIVMIRDQAAVMICEGIQKVSIFTGSQAALNRIQHNGIGPGQTWASAIIRNTNEIRWQNIEGEFRWVPGHAGIEGNETAGQFATDAAEPENEEELPSEDRCTSLSHLRRCTKDTKWNRSSEWFSHKCRIKKYYRRDDQHKPKRVVAKTEKSTAQMYYQIQAGHALISPHLERIKKSDDDTCW